MVDLLHNFPNEHLYQFQFCQAVFLYNLVGLWLFSLFTFPFFVIMSRANRERDKDAPFFSVSNHFFLLICVLEPLLIPLHASETWGFIKQLLEIPSEDPPVHESWKSITVRVVYLLPMAVIDFFIPIVANLLISFIAIHRLSAAHFPSIEAIFEWIGEKTKIRMVICYLISLIFLYLYNPFLLEANPDLSPWERETETEKRKNFLIFASGLLIVYFVDFLTVIPSLIYSLHLLFCCCKPRAPLYPHYEQRLKYLIVMTMFSKLLLLPNTIAVHLMHLEDPKLTHIVICQMTAFSFTAQLSYLMSKKRQFLTLLRSFWRWRASDSMDGHSTVSPGNSAVMSA